MDIKDVKLDQLAMDDLRLAFQEEADKEILTDLKKVVDAKLPTEPGYYLWYILDFGYFNVGAVQILQDNDKHIQHLRERLWEDRKGFYLYQTGWQDSITLTMYHQAANNLPPCNKFGQPMVDGWMPFDFRNVGLIKEPPIKLKLDGPRMLEASPEDVQKVLARYTPPEDVKPKFQVGDLVRVKPELAEISAEGIITNTSWNKDHYNYYFGKRWEKESNLEKKEKLE